MTQIPSQDEMIVRAAELAHAAPREWAGFLTALKVYADGRKTECVQAPLADLQVAQGRAQNAASMLGLFEKAVQTANAITARRR